ncbi:MAG TPA: formaldehyde-activating enzyme [Dongiaceae bacterium]|jgi:5,6,7,8-tetrahydromethanopterin hydro-lyase|nr:formaldehyde-activating enzyme [Dongiaceae bacterium]
MLIGEGFAGEAPNAAHVNLLLGPKDGPMGTAYAVAAASPSQGHMPFQVVLKPGLPVEPATLFIAKATLRNPTHETMTWGPAQMGVAAGITTAVLDGVLPADAREHWLAIACAWVHWDVNDADAVFANNRDATLAAARAAMQPGRISIEELRQALATQGNVFYTPRR